jgi:hypothetical protein
MEDIIEINGPNRITRSFRTRLNTYWPSLVYMSSNIKIKLTLFYS